MGSLARASLAALFYLACFTIVPAKDEMTSSLLIGNARIDIKIESSVDLGSLWTQLGVQSDGAGVRFDDNATLAAVRRAITTRESATAQDPTFFNLLAVFVGRAVCLSDRPGQRGVVGKRFARLRSNSIAIPGDEVKALREAAQDLKIAIVIGVNEHVDAGPGNGTLYNSLLTISEDGQLKNHHRKLVPTYTERLVWRNRDGHSPETING